MKLFHVERGLEMLASKGGLSNGSFTGAAFATTAEKKRATESEERLFMRSLAKLIDAPHYEVQQNWTKIQHKADFTLNSWRGYFKASPGNEPARGRIDAIAKMALPERAAACNGNTAIGLFADRLQGNEEALASGPDSSADHPPASEGWLRTSVATCLDS